MTASRRTIPRLAAALAGACLLLAAPPARAKIDLVTLPESGDVELTIYNGEDLTLVRERRALSFKEGANPLQFSWANTLIDPTSVHLVLVEGADFLDIEDISYPANTANTLVWAIDAARSGEGVVEIAYFTSGISWEADYVAKANRQETAISLEGYVRVTNNSGEDYMDAKTRLLVGEINLVEEIAELSRDGMDWSDKRQSKKRDAEMRMRQVVAKAKNEEGAGAPRRQKEVAKEGVSEYFLFTIEGREDLENGLSKRLPSFRADDVPVQAAYKHNPWRWGSAMLKFYKLKNDEPSKLGASPLPNGAYRVFRAAGDDSLAYVGLHNERYVPIGEDLELNLGNDGLVLLEDRRNAFRRLRLAYSKFGDVDGWDEEEDWTIVLRNSRDQAVPVELARRFDGDFDFAPSSDSPGQWTKASGQEYELKATLAPMSETRFAYTVTRRSGSRARK